MAAVIVVIGVLGAIGGLMIYGVFVGTFVLSLLWSWFVTPTLGIPVPPFPMLAGVSLVSHYLTSHAITTYEGHKANTGADICTGLIMPWFTLLIGWLIHLWAGA